MSPDQIPSAYARVTFRVPPAGSSTDRRTLATPSSSEAATCAGTWENKATWAGTYSARSGARASRLVVLRVRLVRSPVRSTAVTLASCSPGAEGTKAAAQVPFPSPVRTRVKDPEAPDTEAETPATASLSVTLTAIGIGCGNGTTAGRLRSRTAGGASS